MLKFRRLKLSILVLCAIAATVSNLPLSRANNSQDLLTTQMIMPSPATTDIIKNVTLIAKEETRPPLGISRKSDRDLGFASVFLRLENSQLENVSVSIQKIEIRNLTDGQLEPFDFSAQEISLKPLENAEIVFHLTNKTGYGDCDRVKAIVTYQKGERVNIIESEIVEVDRS